MTIALTVLLGLLSLGILAGRVYEILKLTDIETGFFIYKGIVFNPYILIIFTVITICCAVIIFGGSKKVQPFFSKSSKIIAVASGAMFVLYGIMAVGHSLAVLFVIAGGLALIVMGIFELRPEATVTNIIAVVLSVIFVAGMCLDVIAFNVNTIYNIEFIKNALSYIFAGVFILMVMKNTFAPSAYSPMFLYITGIMAFVMCGIMNIADIIAMAADGNVLLPKLFFNAGFAFFGFFAFDNAISVMPKKIIADRTESDRQISENSAEKEELQTADVALNRKNAKNDTEKLSFEKFAQMYADTSADTEPRRKKTVKSAKNKTEKSVFVRSGENSGVTDRKDGGKVVYKKPKD